MLSSDQDEPSIWAKNIKRFKEGSFKREGAFESSQIRDLVTIGHVEDVNKYLLQLPDGPYSISDAEIKDLNKSRPVRQPAYRITAPVMGPSVAEGHVKIGDSEVPVREYLGEEWVKNRVLSAAMSYI